MKKYIYLLLTFCCAASIALFISCREKKTLSSELENVSLNLIPKPDSITIRSGFVDISNGFYLNFNKVPDDARTRLTEYLEKSSIHLDKKGKKLSLKLTVKTDSTVSDESYVLKINRKGVSISAPTDAGLFYGIQTLLQLIEKNNEYSSKLPFLEITDSPYLAYRGLHIDVSRHFFSLDFIKKQIDLMAYYKLNYFHWHLTDGPGWRLEIKKYPELTRIAAWRTHALWKDWWASGRKYVKEGTPGAYGGYYTQDEARELVRYAAERHITVIPEIEMPGHSEEVLAVYPQLACTEKPYTSSEFCIGNDETFEFLENVLSEVIEIFPSQYIHIGGDEASKEHWEKCPKCQARIKKEGLKNEAELQSYLIRRVEKFLHSKGRKLIGWDEILEGGLDKSAVVMAWRGEDIGIEAARDGHKVIMTPGAYCYFDSYQGTPDTQPEAIGGFLPVEKVYAYNPVPDSLSRNDAKRVWGVQANLWTEYISTPQHAEYMLYPRLLALAEVAWTKPAKRTWSDFKHRLNNALPVLQKKGYQPYTLSKEPFVELSNDTVNHAIHVKLSSELFPVDIRYTTDGTMPNAQSALYDSVIQVKDSALLMAQLFNKNEPLGRVIERRIDHHKAIGKKVNYITPFSPYYPASGKNALIDGLPGGLSHGDGYWQGFNVSELDVVIDLEKNETIKFIRTNFLQNGNAWIWFPKEVIISVSNGEESYREIAKLSNKIPRNQEGTLFQTFEWKGEAQARYIRIKAPSNGGWLFMDEVVVW